jgi:hypothetical protein
MVAVPGLTENPEVRMGTVKIELSVGKQSIMDERAFPENHSPCLEK